MKYLTNYYYSKPLILSSTPVVVILVAIIYIILAKAGFLITIPPGKVTPIFPACGFALAAALIWGKTSFYGIWFGTFYSNTFFNIDFLNIDWNYFLPHLAIGVLNAFGSVIGVAIASYVVNSFCKENHPLYSGRNVLVLLVLGSTSYATVTSCIGVLSFLFGNTIRMGEFWYTFETWWLGDVIGIILFTPFILVWFLKKYLKNNNIKILELILFGLTTVLLCIGVFFEQGDLKYLLLPLLFWSAYRFGVLITTTVIITIALFAIFSTSQRIGPFVANNSNDNINDSILFLDLFLSIITICSLFLSGILSERLRAEEITRISEENLRKNQDILQSTIESPKDISIYSIGRNYEYLSFNSLHSESMRQIYKTTIAVGMRLHDCISNKNILNEAIAVLDSAFLGKSITTIKHFDTNNSFWELRSSPIENEKKEIIGATIISTNITSRIETEETIKKSEEKYRNIFENIQDVFFQSDLDGCILGVSPSSKELLEYSMNELIGQSVSLVYYNFNERENLLIELKEKGIVKNAETILITKSGLKKHISLDARLIYDAEKRPTHIDGFIRDITQKKESEIEIANQNNKLQIQNKELEQFAYITSHDLQEPLLTLKCFSELIKEEFPKDIDENLNQYLNFILESSDRMQKLIKGLLDYSRIGRQIEITKVDCNEIVKKAISSLTDSIVKNEVEITIKPLPIISGYSIELIELFEHLISNAIKFRKKYIPLTIHINAKAVKDNWLFSLTDNGIGIEENNKEKAFILFKRLNNREEYSGIGIGLAICKKIIELHGGTIWLEAKCEHGTRINFTIPKKE